MWWTVGGLIFTLVVGYIVFTIFSSSGSELESNSIDAFIIESDSELPRSVNQTQDNKYVKKYDKPGRQVLILYGTEYGFSEEVARELFDIIETSVTTDDLYPWQPRVLNAKFFEAVDFSRESLVFVVISTAGDGVPPTEAREFCESLTHCVSDLSNVRFSVLAMGDTNYPHFCKAGKLVDQRLSALGCCCIIPRHDVDMEDRGVVQSWLSTVMEALSGVDVEPQLDYIDIGAASLGDGQPDRNAPFRATLKVKYDLTHKDETSDKETSHCEFDLSDSGITWDSGDALAIYPQNNPPEVTRLLLALGSTGEEKVSVPKWAFLPKPETTECPVRLVLTTYYDLKSIKPELLQALHQKCNDRIEQENLSAILKLGISKSNSVLHNYLYEREVVDVLMEFVSATAAIPLGEILSLLKPLQPRYYSISSSPLVNPDTACVTAAVVRYSSLGTERTGVCTTYIHDRLQINQSAPVFISRNPEFRLPPDPSHPIIMIGPGTGIAPFRAFIQERIHVQCSGKNRLYFGCRHRNKDYLYKDQLEQWEAEGHIELRTAFSRDQSHKIYVQDLIKEDSNIVWSMLNNEGAHLYVCGDAKHMAHDVHKALSRIIMTCGGFDQQGAQQYMVQLEQRGRYQKDVWVT